MNHLDVTRKVPSAQEIMNQLIQAERAKCASYREIALQDLARHVLPFLNWRREQVNNLIRQQIDALPANHSRKPIKERYFTLIRKYIDLRQKYYKALQLLRYNKQKPANS